MGKRKRARIDLAEYDPGKPRSNWFSRLPKSDRDEICAQLDAWLAGEYPAIVTIADFCRALYASPINLGTRPPSLHTLREWVREYREGRHGAT